MTIGRTNRGNAADKTVCLSDRIKQYIDFVFEKLSKYDDIGDLEDSKKIADDIYHDIRSDLFINGKDPRGIAAAIMLFTLQRSPLHHKTTDWQGEEISKAIYQRDIADILGISEVTVRNNGKSLSRVIRA
jgi:transcription initiation factor TFIIIB Brf1 subunit/transcription initiation factor TFIIB